ncbi:MAG: hypothetical protein OK474_09540 [Thaumarchaeota archaeon]|nr:hypothetical protein [Nitrososphaerota archaeon]
MRYLGLPASLKRHSSRSLPRSDLSLLIVGWVFFTDLVAHYGMTGAEISPAAVGQDRDEQQAYLVKMRVPSVYETTLAS